MQVKQLYNICSILLNEGLELSDIEADHDILYFVMDEDSISPKVREDLASIGFFYDEEQDCYMVYV
jgi:hypothetical protein